MPTRTATRDGQQAGVAWRSLAVFAGGAEHLDDALARAVAPAIREGREQGALQRWYFSRWVGERGPHLRLALAGDAVDAVGAQIGERLSANPASADVRAPVLTPPASQRRGGRHVGVEPAEHRSEGDRFGAGLAAAERLFEVSSDLVVDVLPALARGHERVSYGLALMQSLSEIGVARTRRADFWREVAARWAGGDERAAEVRDRIAVHARRLGPDLLACARRLRTEGSGAAALQPYAQACDEMLATGGDTPAEELVRHHAHLTGNRLGVNPLEELLLAIVLAQAPGDDEARSPAATRPASTAPPGDEAVHLEQISKDGDDRPALDDVSLTVARGEVFGLVGPEGAGKSSLLGVAAGLRVMSAGTVRVLGADPLSDRQALAGDVGVLPADDELAGARSVRENLDLRAGAGGASADDVLAAIGLRELAATAVDDLDRGRRRLVTLGCALMTESEVLFLDEPTADLSAVERDELWRVIRAVAADGTTVLLATTSLQEMRSACDRAALMLAGRIVDVGDPDELAEHHFSTRTVHFRTVDEPDVALLDELPEVSAVKVDTRPDHYALEVTTTQPDELLRVIGNDPDFPEIVWVAAEDLDATFAMHARATGADHGPGSR